MKMPIIRNEVDWLEQIYYELTILNEKQDAILQALENLSKSGKRGL